MCKPPPHIYWYMPVYTGHYIYIYIYIYVYNIISVNYSGYSSDFKVMQCIPLGPTLRPLLFLISINYLLAISTCYMPILLVLFSHFNSYFINVGSEALDSTVTLNKPPFASYLGPRCHLAFSFSYTNSEKILKTIEKLKPKTSSGPDGQSSKLLKVVGNILAPTLSVIINQSLYTGIFPDKLKVAKVCPSLKKVTTGSWKIIDPFLYYQHCLKYLKGLY